MKYNKIREEELKNKVGADWFRDFDTTEIIGNIDFSVFPKQSEPFGRTPLLWAEAKTGDYDLATMFVQLILTIGKARSFDKTMPPAFLGAFDFKNIAFVPYIAIQDIFYLNDFNWNVTPSNHQSKEFLLIKEKVEASLKKNQFVFDYEKNEKELKFFIKNNIAGAKTSAKIKIDKNNFITVYLRWLESIKPIIDINESSWQQLKENGIIDTDFYLADLFVDDKDTQDIEDDVSIHESLSVIYQNQSYKISKENTKAMFDATKKGTFDINIDIRNKEIYQEFWKIYKRPPIKEYQEYIIKRRDLLVPQDIRERKGAFFTPRQWVELSQKYLTDVFGENWQEEYYIWDCAAGTGNLLAGLRNKYNIYASTLDQADVNVMHERIEHGANLLKNHCFQFDFLNDEFIPQNKDGKVPDSLFDIINDEEKRKKLIIYINPPYAEATTAKTITGTGSNKAGVSKGSKTHTKYKPIIRQAANEIFALFLIRIYKEIPNSKIANFSTLKNLQSSNFSHFRKFFRALLEKIFFVPADTFDNVSGKFPIGFMIWNGEKEEIFSEGTADVYDRKGIFNGEKTIYLAENFINQWYSEFYDQNGEEIGVMNTRGNDFQNQNYIRITSENNFNHTNIITAKNLIPSCIYLAVRHCMEATWLNDRDQFLYPNNGWESDTEFQNDCLAFTLFHGQNRINAKEKTNHWIPFKEQEVNAQEKFNSNFMTNFIAGKLTKNQKQDNETLFEKTTEKQLLPTAPLKFSEEAKELFDAGKELWKYYHSFPNVNPNASLYNIREYFQGRNQKNKMNTKSNDKNYIKLIEILKDKLNIIGKKNKPKIYEYGFLKK